MIVSSYLRRRSSSVPLLLMTIFFVSSFYYISQNRLIPFDQEHKADPSIAVNYSFSKSLSAASAPQNLIPTPDAAAVGGSLYRPSRPLSAAAPAEWQRFNLLEPKLARLAHTEQYHSGASSSECTLDKVNREKLAQDHPCVIDIIRREFLHPPSPPEVPYNLRQSNSDINYDTSDGKSTVILNLLNNKTGGFFIESGTFDGEFMSTTLFMERAKGWSGILIEANPKYYAVAVTRNRKAWMVPACLSLEPYATKVSFQVVSAEQMLTRTDTYSFIVGVDMSPNQKSWLNATDVETITVQCFPLYSILLAVNRTDIDYFSLDVEGHDFKVVKTIPWSRLDVETISVETAHVAEGKEAVIRYMEDHGYKALLNLEGRFNDYDTIFKKNK